MRDAESYMTQTGTEVGPPPVRSNIILAMDDRTRVRAYLYTTTPTNLVSMLEHSEQDFRSTLKLYSVTDQAPILVDWERVKAVFFVNAFEGNSKRDDCRFFSRTEISSIWVEVEFKDGEILEGCVHNSIHHLIEDGFFLHPSSPNSNNRLIYVNKKAIESYRVLGLRSLANL